MLFQRSKLDLHQNCCQTLHPMHDSFFCMLDDVIISVFIYQTRKLLIKAWTSRKSREWAEMINNVAHSKALEYTQHNRLVIILLS